MVRPLLAAVLGLILSAPLPLLTRQHAGVRKQLIAHRGASGYAPEHTLPAYRLSLDYGVDFVEPDLAISRDGVLICLHDETLQRTTDVEEVYPDRFSQDVKGRGDERQWIANDFTLAEIVRLDAGSWMDPKFAGTRVPTWDEMLALVRGRAGVYPELKSPAFYAGRGVDMVRIFADSVRSHGLDRRDSLKRTPVVVQSFDEASVRRLADELPTIPRVFLTSSDRDVTDPRLRELATFATGIAPDKRVIARHPDMVARAHALGLTVTSWTFRADENTSYPTVRDEMAQYLYTWVSTPSSPTTRISFQDVNASLLKMS